MVLDMVQCIAYNLMHIYERKCLHVRPINVPHLDQSNHNKTDTVFCFEFFHLLHLYERAKGFGHIYIHRHHSVIIYFTMVPKN